MVAATLLLVNSVDAQLQAQLDTTAPVGLVGVGSCTASGCHGGGDAFSVAGSEYNVWIARDPHARAYSALFDERSLQILRRLKRLSKDAVVAAHQEASCLACHSQTSDQSNDPPHDVVTDGVGCESCHGPANNWLADHFRGQVGYTALNATDLGSRGMWNTKSLTVRTQICARCHVGGPGRDVNHELIAAGHPRMQFEMSAYFEAMPKHWDEAKDHKPWGADFDAMVWAIGQAGTSQASFRQLATRAESAAAWPELAEWSCSACHHSLRDDPARQERLAQSGGLSGQVMTWDTWNHFSTRHHLSDLSAAFGLDAKSAAQIDDRIRFLDSELSKLDPDRRLVAAAAREAAATLGRWSAPMERARLARAQLDRLTQALVARPLESGAYDWAAATQLYNALANIQQTRLRSEQPGGDNVTVAIKQMYDGLAAVQRSPDVNPFRPELIREQLQRIGNALPTEDKR
jgi:hypothetical protein